MGFFDLATLPSASIEGKSDIAPKIHNCKSCGRFSTCETPKITACGEGKRRILVVGPPVTSVEDSTGNERHGTTYSYLKSHLGQCGINIEEDCWYTHAIRCHSKTEKIPVTTMSACHRMLLDEIDELDPLVIVPTCPESWEVLLYERMAGRAAVAQYSDWCGEVIPDQVLQRWITPLYTPSFVKLYDEKQVNPYHLTWHEHMQKILTLTEKPPVLDTSVTVCRTVSEAIASIKEAQGWKLFAYDYETTGIKPYRKGHKIAYVSVSNGIKAFAWKHYDDPTYLEELQKLLQNDAHKIAHNQEFERSWTRNILGYPVRGLVHDTMLLQHIHNCRKPTGLKFCVYAYYGVLGYDSDADEFLKSDPAEKKEFGSNGFNRVFSIPSVKAMTYNAMDSEFTAWLFNDLITQLDPVHQRPGYDFFMEACIALANSHEEGIRVDTVALEKTSAWIDEQIRPFIDKVMEDPLIVKGWTGKRAFNPQSDHDIGKLLFKILGLEPIAFTDKGQPSVDADSLEYFRGKVSIIEPLYEVKRLNMLQRYIKQIRAEENDGLLKPFFNLNRVPTMRSSSNSINFQSLPKRNKESMKTIRDLLYPKKGHMLQEIDLKGAEVSIAAAVTGDKNLISYVSDLSKDMHRDLASSIFFVDKEEVSKALRGDATKGPFTFAEFYGSWYKEVAAGIWAVINVPDAVKTFGFDVVKHLKKCGVRTYEAWEKHIQEQERVLWDEFFPGYKRWREHTWESFCETGYIDFATGFRYVGPATRNEALNAPVQGPAFHVNLWAYTEIDRETRERGMNSCLIGEIHDSQVSSVDPMEVDIYNAICKKYLCEKVREKWDWITVPIMAEVDRAEVDEPWSRMKGRGFL